MKRIYKSPLKAAIFDWAGTTVDCGCCAPAGVFKRVFEDRGVEISDAEAREPMGLHKRDHIRRVSEMDRVALAWREAHGKPCSEEDVEEMFNAFIPIQLGCLRDFSNLTEGARGAIQNIQERGMKIGTTTGYNREMLEILLEEAEKQGYRPDSSFCAADVPSGRPAPWMAFRNTIELGVYPMEAYVKVGDTPSDIGEGLNAGMWTIGVSKVGNEVGLNEEELRQASPADLERKIDRANGRLLGAGAHYLVETLAEVPALIDEINQRLAHGERP